MTTKATAEYEAVNASRKCQNNQAKQNRKSPLFLPALAAVGGAFGLAALPVNALELGEIQVDSAIGQPLRASIAYALNQNEQIHDYCIYLRPAGSADNFPSVGDARISLTNNAIVLAGSTAVREPILGMQVAVDCAYTPNLTREYVVILSPEAQVVPTRSVIESKQAVQDASKQAAQPAADGVRLNAGPSTQYPVPRTGDGEPAIDANGRYRVLPGDNISTIVSRIPDRKIGLWPAIRIIFAANPGAFVDQDINRLIVGSELVIPDLLEVPAVTEEHTANSPAIAIEPPEIAGEMIGDIMETDPVESTSEAEALVAIDTDPAIAESNRLPASSLNEMSAEDSIAVDTQDTELRPGDVIIVPVESGNTESNISDMVSNNSSPVALSVRSMPATSNGISGAWSWLLWLAGTGVGLIIGLLLFGRALKDHFGLSGARAAEAPRRRQNESSADTAPIIDDVDFKFEDTINASAISLDADLGNGSGLNAGAEMDVAQDFGYSASDQLDSELDLEITEEATREPEASPTDIIPPNHREESVTVVESEELPTHDYSGEYDFSMIVDATKQPIGDYEATAKDLQAVRVEVFDTYEEDQTASGDVEVDYHALEQDYQEEFTATQAANAEIEKVAMELARRIEEDSGNVTTEMPAADTTSELPIESDHEEQSADSMMPSISNPDITAELTANLLTTIDAENDAIADDRDDEITIEMSTAGSDVTIEMPLDSARSKGRKKQT